MFHDPWPSYAALDPVAACSVHPEDPRHAVAFMTGGILTSVRCEGGPDQHTCSQHFYFGTESEAGPVYQHRDVVACAVANEADVLFCNAASCTVCVAPLDADGADALPVLAFATMPGAYGRSVATVCSRCSNLWHWG